MKYYSKSKNGFYDSEINKDIPSDKVELAETVYRELLDGQSNGMRIVGDSNGNPKLEVIPVASAEEIALAKNIFSKLAIRRAMRSLGSEDVLDAILAGNVDFGKDWADSDEGIDLSDPSVIEAIQEAGIDVNIIKLKIAGLI